MGEVRTEITLVNIVDQGSADRGYIPQEQVRRITVNAVVDTGATTLVINEKTRETLGLTLEETGEAALAGGVKIPSGVTETVMVHWEDRKTPCQAVLLPDEEEVLLGALPLEGLDLMVHPLRQEVIGAHGDKVRIVVK
ncbi:MAG: retroviral-like aspartic protease family protein [Spirochaetaceae bacterium]|nr:retroviral-like aspartic protease family protein [Spirochaetaceae bacterium]